MAEKLNAAIPRRINRYFYGGRRHLKIAAAEAVYEAGNSVEALSMLVPLRAVSVRMNAGWRNHRMRVFTFQLANGNLVAKVVMADSDDEFNTALGRLRGIIASRQDG